MGKSRTKTGAKEKSGSKKNRTAMEVDKPGGGEAKWETGAAAGAMDTAEGGFGVVEGASAGAPSAPASTAGDASHAKTITSRGFGIVVGGIKKRKVQLSFKQKRRKNKHIEKGVARAEIFATTQKRKDSGRERKKEMNHLW